MGQRESRRLGRYAEFGRLLAAARRRSGENQGGAADQLGVTQSYLSRLERGVDRPALPLLTKITQRYGLDLDNCRKLLQYVEEPEVLGDGFQPSAGELDRQAVQQLIQETAARTAQEVADAFWRFMEEARRRAQGSVYRGPETNAEFGRLVTRALGDRSAEEVASEAGVPALCIQHMAQGHIPPRGVLVSYASACGLSFEETNDLLDAAGEDVLTDSDQQWDPNAALRFGLRVMQDVFSDHPIPLEEVPSDVTGYSDREVGKIMARLERKLIDRYGPMRLVFRPGSTDDAELLREKGLLVDEKEEDPKEVFATAIRDVIDAWGKGIPVNFERINTLRSTREALEYVEELERRLEAGEIQPREPHDRYPVGGNMSSRRESPRQMYWRRIGALVEHFGYRPRSYKTPPMKAVFRNGSSTLSYEEVDTEVQEWLDQVREMNPDKPFDQDRASAPE